MLVNQGRTKSTASAMTGGMMDKLKQKLKVAYKAVAELEELLAGIGSE